MGVENQKSPLLRVKDGEIPGAVITIAENISVILTHAAIVNKTSGGILRGHTLFIPHRNEIQNKDDMTPQERGELGELQSLFAKVLRELFQKDKTEEFISGHEVTHFHTHMVPANRGETDWSQLPKKPNYSLEDRLNDADKIQSVLKDIGKHPGVCYLDFPDNRNTPVNQNAT